MIGKARPQFVADVATDKSCGQTGHDNNGAEGRGHGSAIAIVAINMNVIRHPESQATNGKGHRGHAQRVQNIRRGLEKNRIIAPTGDSAGLPYQVAVELLPMRVSWTTLFRQLRRSQWQTKVVFPLPSRPGLPRALDFKLLKIRLGATLSIVEDLL
jgi:hypothetical protein